jgi:tetratricopeptide (TPR) repeat protein
MTLGRSFADKGDYLKSVESYKRVLELQNPISAAEAQYRIGEVLQKQAEEMMKASDQHNSKWGKGGLSAASALQKAMGGAIAAYRRTYETYPESSFAADSLGRVVRHHVDTENFSMAADLLDSVFSDYPDAAFLDEMLLLWSNVGYRMGDNDIAKAKLRQLITDYPSSKHITEARSKLAGIEAEAAKSSGE